MLIFCDFTGLRPTLAGTVGFATAMHYTMARL
jgi:hypothetical protein